MKNIIKKAALITILLMGITCASKAVTVSFILHIDDLMTPVWTRDYCAQVYVMEGNVQHCVEQFDGLSIDDNLISYDCYLPYSESDPNYSIFCRVWRNESPIIPFIGSATDLYFNNVTSGFTLVKVILQ